MSPIERLQKDCAERLEALSFFVDVPVYVFRPREKATAAVIQSQIDKALSGLEKKADKSGAACMVLMPLGNVPDPNVPGPEFELAVTIRCQEIPVVNMGSGGTGKSAEEIALAVSNGLHQFSTGYAALYASRDAITPVGPADATDRRITYDVSITTRLGIATTLRVPRPSISGTAAAVQLACIDAAAEIWWTVDGTYPRPGNATATEYLNAFAVLSGETVRAAAYRTDFQPSDVVQKTF